MTAVVTVESNPVLERERIPQAFPLQRIAEVMDELGGLLADLPNPRLGDRRITIEIEAAANPLTGATERVEQRLWLSSYWAEIEGRLVYRSREQVELIFAAQARVVARL